MCFENCYCKHFLQKFFCWNVLFFFYLDDDDDNDGIKDYHEDRNGNQMLDILEAKDTDGDGIPDYLDDDDDGDGIPDCDDDDDDGDGKQNFLLLAMTSGFSYRVNIRILYTCAPISERELRNGYEASTDKPSSFVTSL